MANHRGLRFLPWWTFHSPFFSPILSISFLFFFFFRENPCSLHTNSTQYLFQTSPMSFLSFVWGFTVHPYFSIPQNFKILWVCILYIVKKTMVHPLPTWWLLGWRFYCDIGFALCYSYEKEAKRKRICTFKTNEIFTTSRILNTESLFSCLPSYNYFPPSSPKILLGFILCALGNFVGGFRNLQIDFLSKFTLCIF